MRLQRTLLAAVLASCVHVALVRAQETRAILSGTVSDPQGAVVPAAKVEIKNLNTNIVTDVQTNDKGAYTAPPINPGQYAVTVTATGFKVAVENNVELRSADEKNLDFKLQLGAASETVAVTSEAALLDTVTASQSSTQEAIRVENVPTYAEDVFQLLRYTAGAVGGTTTRPFDGGDNGVTILGGTNNEVLLDGSANTYRESTGAANAISPPPEAVGEVKVITNPYDAEYGRTGGGVVSISIKSGTNQYHGSIGWLNRTSALNANSFDGNASGAPNASFRLNEPSAELDGPFRIPKIYDGRNRTFFTYAVNVYRDSRPTGNTLVDPTALERVGNFSDTFVSGTSGATVQIYDPLTTVLNGSTYTRTPFAGGIIPLSRINPIAQTAANLFLLPTQVAARGLVNTGVYPNYDHEPYNIHTFRLDHQLNSKETLFATVEHDMRGQINGGGAGYPAFIKNNELFASNNFAHWRGNQAYSLDLTSVLSSTLVSTARASFNRHVFGIQYYSDGYDETKLGFPSSLLGETQGTSFPSFSIAGYMALGGGADTHNFSNNLALGETVSKSLGKQTLKFGGEWRFLQNDQSSPPPSLTVTATAAFTQANPLVSSASSGDAMASFLLGYPSAVSSSFNSFPAEGQHFWAAFLQDDWRVSKKLTLNLGLRWEFETPIVDRYNHIVDGFCTTCTSNVGGVPVTGGLTFASANNRNPYNADHHEFGPRAGFAYQVNQKMVIRGGWAIFFQPTADVAPYTGYSYSTAPSTSVSNAGVIPLVAPGCTGASCGMLSNPFPTGILTPPGNSLGLLTNVGQSVSFIDPKREVPYSHVVSIGVQYQLPFNTLLEASYNGRFSRDVETSLNLDNVTYAQYLADGSTLTSSSVPNPYAGLLPGTSLNGATMSLQQSLLPYPQFTGVTESGMSNGTAKYQSLVVQVEKRLSQNFSVLLTGTFGKSTTYSTYLNNGMDAPGQFITRDGGTPPHEINISGVYKEPFFKQASLLPRILLAGWQLSGYTQWVSGGLLNVSGAYPTGHEPAFSEPRVHGTRLHTCTYTPTNTTTHNCAAGDPVAWTIQKPFTLNTVPPHQWSNFLGRALPETSRAIVKIFRIN